jgi:hypothetical protein
LLQLDIGSITEVGPFHRLPLADLFVSFVCQQMMLWVETRSQGEAFTDREINEIIRLTGLTLDTRYLFLMSRLASAGRILRPFAYPHSEENAELRSLLAILGTSGYETLFTVSIRDAVNVIQQVQAALPPAETPKDDAIGQ